MLQTFLQAGLRADDWCFLRGYLVVACTKIMTATVAGLMRNTVCRLMLQFSQRKVWTRDIDKTYGAVCAAKCQ